MAKEMDLTEICENEMDIDSISGESDMAVNMDVAQRAVEAYQVTKKERKAKVAENGIPLFL